MTTKTFKHSGAVAPDGVPYASVGTVTTVWFVDRVLTLVTAYNAHDVLMLQRTFQPPSFRVSAIPGGLGQTVATVQAERLTMADVLYVAPRNWGDVLENPTVRKELDLYLAPQALDPQEPAPQVHGVDLDAE